MSFALVDQALSKYPSMPHHTAVLRYWWWWFYFYH